MRHPFCPACGTRNPRVVLATREVMMLRCTACDHSWSVDTPVISAPPARDRRGAPDRRRVARGGRRATDCNPRVK
jgi:hypothetical protein